MPLIRPRLTDYFDLPVAQADCDFAIPLLDEDLPLFVDPFLLWKSPSLQDTALHTSMIHAFNRLVRAFQNSDSRARAIDSLVTLSECNEAGLGSARNRVGRRISRDLSEDSLATLGAIPDFNALGIQHIEITQLLVPGIGKDRISDIACSFLKSFLIDFTIEQCRIHRIPTTRLTIHDVFDHASLTFRAEPVELPISPENNQPILLIPKRWLRYSPWINYDAYFDGGFVKGADVPRERPSILLYNRSHYGMVREFVIQREARSVDCKSDPVFAPIPVLSAKRRMAAIRTLPTGNQDRADKIYEENAGSLLASTLYPQLDFASLQTRTDSGSQIRDAIFYNTRTWDFLQDVHRLYDSRQLVFELKNVAQLEREHVNQLNRYLADQFGRFGVLLTRNAPPRHIQQNLIDLWAGQRRCLIVLTDEDLDLMVTLFESRQRLPIEVLKRSYVTFTRTLPA